MDIVLVFPPQWSPFQPPLSLPALSAWLKRAGFTVKSFDANLQFYEWLISDELPHLLRQALERSMMTPAQLEGYRYILDTAPEVRAELGSLRNAGKSAVSNRQFLNTHFIAIHALEAYLHSVSAIARDFSLTPYSFELPAIAGKRSAIASTVDQPPELIRVFADRFIERQIAPANPKLVGLSCIGQEQFYFTLVLGATIKRRLSIPVVIGGTIFPRLFESGGLDAGWFGKYFDIVVRNEGEKPCETLLRNVCQDRRLEDSVPGIIYTGQPGLATSPPSPPLIPAELPIPDFDDLPLDRYFSSHTTLPLLSARGCYWGKCEFCHHGMVYGEKYAAYDPRSILETVRALSDRYGVRHFSFNDEAIPPKIARHLGTSFPDEQTSGWNFTALIKFEKFYTRQDFENLRRIGFRSLYVGLESASERVLSLMKKPNSQQTILGNLKDATAAGIWTHCFLFFGFPGEEEEDAAETHDFVLSHEAWIGSVGCGVFSLEHNAPIFHHPEHFKLELESIPDDSLSVYYRYRAGAGIGAARAQEWMRLLNRAVYRLPKYAATNWIPREHLLCLLSAMSPEQLIEFGTAMEAGGGVAPMLRVRDLFSVFATPDHAWPIVAVNRLDHRVVKLSGAAASILRLLYDENAALAHVRSVAPRFYGHLVKMAADGIESIQSRWG